MTEAVRLSDCAGRNGDVLFTQAEDKSALSSRTAVD